MVHLTFFSVIFFCLNLFNFVSFLGSDGMFQVFLLDIPKLIYKLDVHMASPPPVHALQGASCTTGGILHGRAHGNVFNHADGEDETYAAPHKGKVFVYQSPRDPKNNKADTSITSEVSPQLKPVLKALARRLSIVSSKSYFLIYVQQKKNILY